MNNEVLKNHFPPLDTNKVDIILLYQPSPLPNHLMIRCHYSSPEFVVTLIDGKNLP